MKKNYIVVTLLSILSACSTQSEHRKETILKSTNIDTITEYLKKAHPEDPKKHILEAKLITLKNKEWTKGAASAKPMEARPILSKVSENSKENRNPARDDQFKILMSESSLEHQNKTKELLNSLVNEDVTKNEAIFVFKNKSNCNLVLKIAGKKFYTLAVPAYNENFLVLDKGQYTISTDVCDVKFTTQKSIQKHLQLSINNPVYEKEEVKKSIAKHPISKKVVKKTRQVKGSK